MKIFFEQTDSVEVQKKDLQSLIQKIIGKHKVVALPHEDCGVVVSSLAYSEETLSLQFDSIAKICDEYGVGRISDEVILMDHIDAIENEEDLDD